MILQALNRYYDRMAARLEAEAPGYSREKISFAIVLTPTGQPIEKIDLRQQAGKKLRPVLCEVPAAVKRTVNPLPNLLWDKTAYVFGRTAGDGRRTAEEHAAFKALHLNLLASADDPGLVALRRFLEGWAPERFDAPPFVPDMLDANIVFRLDGELGFIYEREAAQRLIAARSTADVPTAFCLVTGAEAPVCRLHPSIKGVAGAQSSGAALVSFNLDAFTSYGKEQGANAPTSEAAAFRYGAALNRMLDRGSHNRIPRPIGDATVVFWADASGLEKSSAEAVAAASEDVLAYLFEPPTDTPAGPQAGDESEAAKLRDALQKVAQGRPARDVFPDIPEGVRFYVLGLSPNAARLSVRFWLADTFQHFVDRLGAHWRDLAIEPKPRGWVNPPAVQRLLVRTTALQEKFENIPPLLAGEVMRAVLGGTLYPRTLLTAALTRLRAGDDPGSGWHAAVIKACLNRPFERELEQLRREEPTPARDARIARIEQEKLPVALEPDREDAAYQLGRLFAVLESAQYAALGRVNAPIGDRYYAAASATPARVFGTLLRGLKTHVADARKRGQGGWIEPKVATIMAKLPPELPKTLRLEDQGRFAVGYYHERATRFGQGAEPENTETTGETSDEP